MSQFYPNEPACLIEGHRNNQLFKICLDKDCSQKSRTLCQKCSTDNLHPDCSDFLSHSQNKGFQFTNTDDFNIISTSNFMLNKIKQQEEEEIAKIDKEYDYLLINMTKLIEKEKQEKKIQISNQFQQIITDIPTKFTHLEDLQQNIGKFKDGRTSIAHLNQKAQEKQNQNLKKSQKEDLIFKYSLVPKLALNRNKMLSLNKMLTNLIKQTSLELQYQIEPLLYSNLRYYCYLKENNKEDFSPFQINLNPSQNILKSQPNFLKNERIFLKFKLSIQEEGDNIIVGIAGKDSKQEDKIDNLNWLNVYAQDKKD